MPEEILSPFEQEVKNFLDTPEVERNYLNGANLMLQANRNRILHQNVVRKIDSEYSHSKIEYELTKFIGDKYQKCSAETVEKMEIELAESSATQKTEDKAGKREDHDKLSAKIQAIYNRNMEIYPRMKSLHERLKVLSDEGFTACDRFPHLKELLALDAELRINWDNYDSAKVGEEVEQKIVKKEGGLTSQEVTQARSYISRSIKEIPDNLKKGKDQTDRIKKTLESYNSLIADGQTLKPETIAGLKEIGVLANE